MSLWLRAYRLFIACPSGLDDELDVIRTQCNNRSQMSMIESSCLIQPISWREISGGSERAQTRINRHLSYCDFFLMILHDRWGQSPGSNNHGQRFTSGCEEEFFLAKQLLERKDAYMQDMLIIFKNVTARNMQSRDRQLEKVLAFRDQLEQKHELMYESFDDSNQLSDIVRRKSNEWIWNHENGRGMKEDIRRVGEHIRLGRAFEAENNLDEANHQFRIAAASRTEIGYSEYAQYIFRHSGREKAIEFLESILSKSETKREGAVAKKHLSLMLRAADVDRAIKLAKEALKFFRTSNFEHENEADLHHNLAILYFDKENKPKASEHIEESFRLNQEMGDEVSIEKNKIWMKNIDDHLI